MGILQLPTGAPAAVFLLELLICFGASRIIVVGIAGSLAPDLRPGTIVVPSRALADDGTTRHYVAAGTNYIGADETLKTRLTVAFLADDLKVRTGTIWTTDAPFRETRHAVAAARDRGAIAVDMETAAVYALAVRRQVAACAALVVTDEISEQWRPAFDSPEVRYALDAVAAALPPLMQGAPPRTAAE